jgi:hypothetical protein
MWIKDPKSNEKSVSLTLMSIAFVIACLLVIGEALGKCKANSAYLELFYATAALYFSRKVNVKGSSFSMEQQGNTSEVSKD